MKENSLLNVSSFTLSKTCEGWWKSIIIIWYNPHASDKYDIYKQNQEVWNLSYVTFLGYDNI